MFTGENMLPEPAMFPEEIKRFWEHIEKRNISDCWLWKGSNRKASFRVGEDIYLCSRLAFYFHYNHWPKEYVLHTCDNPLCVNPYHLYDGTALDNAQDRDSKGRTGYTYGLGSNLTKEDVREIRRLYAAKLHTQYSLADMFGVSQSTIQRIVNRKYFTWID